MNAYDWGCAAVIVCVLVALLMITQYAHSQEQMGVQLSWQPTTTRIDGTDMNPGELMHYEVYTSDCNGGRSLINTTTETQFLAIIPNLSDMYCYAIAAVNTVGERSDFREVAVPYLRRPAHVEGLHAELTGL